MQRRLGSSLLLIAIAGACMACVLGQSSRLVEKEVHFPMDLSDTPLIDPPKRIAGYFKLNRTHDARMFYFYFQSRHKPETDPLVLWMTGGPGCSSELAIFFENGPYSINNDTRTLSETKYGWDTLHNMIFVDQPIGTGFSYSQDPRDRVYNEEVVGSDMLDFLYAFFEAHPDLLDNDFFVTGESYAGHYVPAVSSAIYRANELGQGPLTIPLRGLAIGNGMTAPSVQFPAYADFALENKLISKGLHDSIQFWMPVCTWGAQFCDSHKWRFACVIALQVCQVLGFQRILAANPGINVYDITKTCDGPLCYDMSAADEFLNRKSTREALGVGDITWEECNMGVNGDFMGDWLRSYDNLLPALLEDGIRVMIYAGDLDLICNWVGNQRWVDLLQWEQSDSWPAVAPAEWRVDGAAAGTVRELGPLSFVRVYQAGHMVPMDQPAAALSMLYSFTRGHSLTGPQATADPALRARLAAAAAAPAKPVLTLAAPPRNTEDNNQARGDSLSLAQALQAASALQQLAKMEGAEGLFLEEVRGGVAVAADKAEVAPRQRQETYRRDKPLGGEEAASREVVGGEAARQAARAVISGKQQAVAAALGRHGGLVQEGADEGVALTA